MPVNSFTICKLGLPFKHCFLVLHLNIAFYKRVLIQGVLINGMCQFADGTRAAGRREKRTPSLTNSTSDCAVWVRSWRTKRSGIIREISLSMRVLSVAPREADAVGSLKFMQRGTAGGETREEGGSSNSNESLFEAQEQDIRRKQKRNYNNVRRFQKRFYLHCGTCQRR